MRRTGVRPSRRTTSTRSPSIVRDRAHVSISATARSRWPCSAHSQGCSGLTGHAEVVRVVFDPTLVSYATLLRLFWESHDPTQGMRQGNDVGTQYRSGIYVYTAEQRRLAEATRDAYQRTLSSADYGRITTEILDAPEFYYAEAYHQQYLAKNPGGYCGLGGTGVKCPTGLLASVGDRPME